MRSRKFFKIFGRDRCEIRRGAACAHTIAEKWGHVPTLSGFGFGGMEWARSLRKCRDADFIHSARVLIFGMKSGHVTPFFCNCTRAEIRCDSQRIPDPNFRKIFAATIFSNLKSRPKSAVPHVLQHGTTLRGSQTLCRASACCGA